MAGTKGVILAVSLALVACYFTPCQTMTEEDATFESMMSSVEQSDQAQSPSRVRRSNRDWKNHPLFPLYEIDFPVCKDSDREKKLGLCKAWEKSGYCKANPSMMKSYCPQTCGMCKAFAAPACHKSRFGCCWDDSIAPGPKAEGCPPCFDMYRKTCPQFINYCQRQGRNSRFIRYHCFETCGRCAQQRSKEIIDIDIMAN